MSNLGGLHDREATAIALPDTWILDTVALSENPHLTDYLNSLHWITRLNWGYGSTGTLPIPDEYQMFAERVAAYVRASRGCHIWVIGNEPNLPREWPDGRPIFPWDYAACYKLCRRAIKAIPGHENDQVLIAALGPWNDLLKYPGNINGDWVQYFVDVMKACDGEIDGFGLHAYTHGYDVALVTSTAKMDAPFQNRHFNFRTYQDYLLAIPDELAHLPSYITEANGDGPWQAVGLMPAMLEDVDSWNKRNRGLRQVHAVIWYRYPKYDENARFAIQGKPDVINEYRAAIGRGYMSPPLIGTGATPMQEQTSLPFVSTGTSAEPSPAPSGGVAPQPPREISDDFKRRVPNFTPATPQPGQRYYRLIKAEYLPPPEGAQRFGPDHHILVDVLDVQGKRKMDTSVNFYWADGMHIDRIRKTQEPYGVDYPMASAGQSFGVWVGDFRHHSDDVFGMGLGTTEQPDWGHHVTYYLVFQETVAEPVAQPQPTQPTQPATVPVPSLVEGALIPPCEGIITQRWGENPQNYAQFGQPGHNGLDIANSAGTPIFAVADGTVAYVGIDTDYGNYVRVTHPQLGFDSFYAHMASASVPVGKTVQQGEALGAMGSTGNSSGNHLHLEFRLSSGANYVDLSGGYGKGRFDPAIAYHLLSKSQGTRDLTTVVGNAAIEFGIDPTLFDALVRHESSYRPDAVSRAGAIGLAQIMPSTFAEHGPRIGATNIYDPQDNARTGARYLRFLLNYYQGDMRKALTAYNWGPGNVDSGRTPPTETVEYVNEILGGS